MILLKLNADRSEEHTSELQSQFRISYAVFCLKKKKNVVKGTAFSKFRNSVQTCISTQTFFVQEV